MGILNQLQLDGCSAREVVARCDEARNDLLHEMDSLIATAKKENRDFTKAESARCDSIEAGVRTLDAKIESAKKDQDASASAALGEMIRAGRFSGGSEGGDDHGRVRATKHMQADGRGRRFAILNKQDKATSLFPSDCDNACGHFIGASVFGANHATPQTIKNEMKESVGTLGGFTVPERMLGEVIDLARSKSVLNAAGLRVVMMDSDNLLIPKLETDVTVATKAEHAAITFSDLGFGARNLVTHTAVAGTKVSRELWEDSPTLLAEQIDSWLAAKMATTVDSWGIQGTGSAQPLGIIFRDEISTTESVGGITWSDVSAAATTVRVANHEPRSIILHPTIYADLFESTTGDGTNAASNWKGYPPTLEGISFHQSTNCPLANLIVGDFSKYLMGVRTGARVEATTVGGDAFATHAVWLKIVMRFDFVTLDDAAFHILNGITS